VRPRRMRMRSRGRVGIGGWKEWVDVADPPARFMGTRSICGLLSGKWQAKQGDG
jgi:hypothetical protein